MVGWWSDRIACVDAYGIRLASVRATAIDAVAGGEETSSSPSCIDRGCRSSVRPSGKVFTHSLYWCRYWRARIGTRWCTKVSSRREDRDGEWSTLFISSSSSSSEITLYSTSFWPLPSTIWPTLKNWRPPRKSKKRKIKRWDSFDLISSTVRVCSETADAVGQKMRNYRKELIPFSSWLHGEQKQQQELEKEMEALHMGSEGSPKLDTTSPSKKGKG